MELSNQEGEIPIPIPIQINSSSYGHMMNHHHHHSHILIPTSTSSTSSGPAQTLNPQNGPGPIPLEDQDQDHVLNKKPVVAASITRYRECLKNHAASMGGNATDGCGEFMPSGEEGTMEALTCSACNCHRNFHRKEIEGDNCYYPHPQFPPNFNRIGRKFILGHHHHQFHKTPNLGPDYPPPPASASALIAQPQMIMASYNVGGLGCDDQSDDQQEDNNVINGGGGGGGGRGGQMVKKRFRTKFSQEQKEKMLSFAEKVGWKIQKQEEGLVQQFCHEIGVKRRVLKVWMHNNKHNLAKKNNSILPPLPPPPPNPNPI